MSDVLKKYMDKFGDFTEEAMNEVINQLNIKTFSKGTVLLNQGEIPKTCYFVLEGCVREYGITENGDEVTYEFYTEEYAVAAMGEFNDLRPANFSWVCVEDCLLVVGNLDEEEVMFDNHPGLERMVYKMVQDNFGKALKKNAHMISDSIEERYLKLEEERPDLLIRVPQHQIASYLGITPESLSRLKKRINKSKMKIVE